MILTAEQYERVMAELRSEQSRSRMVERRRSPRAGLHNRIHVIPCTTSLRHQPHLVWLRDISTTGICFVFRHALDIGTQLVVVLPRSAGSTLDMLFTVTRCDQVGSGHFSVGARHERVITFDEGAA